MDFEDQINIQVNQGSDLSLQLFLACVRVCIGVYGSITISTSLYLYCPALLSLWIFSLTALLSIPNDFHADCIEYCERWTLYRDLIQSKKNARYAPYVNTIQRHELAECSLEISNNRHVYQLRHR